MLALNLVSLDCVRERETIVTLILIQIGLPLSVAVLSLGILKHAARAATKNLR